MQINDLEEQIKKINNNQLDSITDKVFLDLLLKNQWITMKQNGRFKKLRSEKLAAGKLQLKNKFGFVKTAQTEYYCHHVKGYLDNDFVLVFEKEIQRGQSIECEIITVLKREETKLLVKVLREQKFYLLNEKYQHYNLKIKNEYKTELYEGQIYQAIVTNVTGWNLHVKLEKLIADSNDPDLSMKLILSEFEIATEFSEEAVAEANIYKDQPVELAKEDSSRQDLRSDLTITIDGSDAKDLDDAISLEKIGDEYKLKVSIADVSHYVKTNSALNSDALSRGTSVYFVDRVVPMLPKVLSNGVCSLNPLVNRLTLTCEMIFDKEANLKEYQIYESIIKSKYRMTYSDVNKMIVDEDKELIIKYQEIYGILKEMNKLAKNLNKKRLERGSFNLEDKEAVFEVNKEGDITDIGARHRGDGEKLIEEFMIAANETVASHISYLEVPSIYRVHGQPSMEKIKELFKIFPLFGVTLKGNPEDFHSTSFKTVLDSIDDPIKKRVISDLIVRSLQKAKYSTTNIGHFGLASRYYTHFTSPIRRYPDLAVHRIIKEVLIKGEYDKYSLSELEEIARHSSEKEVKAIKAEQKIEDQKKAKYMHQFIGQEFTGIISAIADFGMFVELENTQRGLVRFRDIAEFVQAVNYKIYLKNKKVLQIGQNIRVQLVGVNVDKGLVDFLPLDLKMKKEEPKNVDNRKKQKSQSQLRNSRKKRGGNSSKRKRNKIDSRS